LHIQLQLGFLIRELELQDQHRLALLAQVVHLFVHALHEYRDRQLLYLVALNKHIQRDIPLVLAPTNGVNGFHLH
jgi:hypothetical protein